MSHSDQPLKCPKCRGFMQPITIEGTEVDRCTACHGLWFDFGEAKLLAERKHAKLLDVGAVSRGEEMNNRARAMCPRCNVKMIHQRDTDQRHIEFESCQICFGVFFDAGEYRDYQDKDLVEGLTRWWKSLF